MEVDTALDRVGLHYSSDTQPGISRRRCGKGFSYVRADGARVRDPQTLARIRALAIPPAYEQVWICSDPNGHLQATGIDARGRKQYRYHAEWRCIRDADKFARLHEFGRALTRIRKKVATDMRKPRLHRDCVIATVVRLLDRTLIRVGNEQYVKENNSYGLTTMRTRHVRVRGSKIRFDFRGKSGVRHSVLIDDPRTAEVMRCCLELPGQELFQYLDDAGEPRIVSSTDVNEYLRAAGGEDFSAKDFRTWYATLSAIEILAPLRFASEREAKAQIKSALTKIAAQLGNTPSMCRKCYVHPGVLTLFLRDELHIRAKRGRNGRERLLHLLQCVSKAPDTFARGTAAKQPSSRALGLRRPGRTAKEGRAWL